MEVADLKDKDKEGRKRRREKILSDGLPNEEQSIGVDVW